MAASGRHPSVSKWLLNLRRSWRSIAWGIAKAFAIIFVAFEVIFGFMIDRAAPRVNALFVTALFAASLAYLAFVSSRVRLHLPGIDVDGAEVVDDETGGDDAPKDAVVTTQVTRLSSNATRVIIANDAPIPVLRAETSLELARESEDERVPADEVVKSEKGKPFSIPARGIYPTAISSVFDHVGIYWIDSAGVRVYDLLGLLSRVRGTSGRWRVRVVPNVYRLTRGIPRERRVTQESLGIPSSPADALDYDRVREYRPGDPLKTIHWKIVAHGQGELYTKLFESPTASTATMVVDPYGPETVDGSYDAALKLHDAMLEGGFSLMEHARENGIEGSLRFFDRAGSLVEARWDGPAMLGWFVETARRPSSTAEALGQSVAGIQTLRDGASGYVLFVTSGLTAESTKALIACRNAGVSLMVVHAICGSSARGYAGQHAYGERLKRASIAVIELEDGPRIVEEVASQ